MTFIKNENYIFFLKKKLFQLIFFFQCLIDQFLIRENKLENKKKIIDLCVYVWGEEYKANLINCLLISLLQQDNIPKLKNKGYKIYFNIYTTLQEDLTELEFHLKSSKFSKYFQINVFRLDKNNLNNKYFLMKCHLNATTRSYRNQSIFGLLASDLFFGNKTISNIVEILEKTNCGIVINHLRVKRKKIFKIIKNKEKYNKYFENNELMKFAIDNSHNSFILGKPKSGREIYITNDKMLLTSTARVSVNFIRLNKSDINQFKLYHDFNLIDKHWPRKLFLERRIKIISNSEIAFLVEITDENEKRIDYLNYDNDHPKYNSISYLANLSSLWVDKV